MLHGAFYVSPKLMSKVSLPVSDFYSIVMAGSSRFSATSCLTLLWAAWWPSVLSPTYPGSRTTSTSWSVPARYDNVDVTDSVEILEDPDAWHTHWHWLTHLTKISQWLNYWMFSQQVVFLFLFLFFAGFKKRFNLYFWRIPKNPTCNILLVQHPHRDH